jgi:hypothetical protein
LNIQLGIAVQLDRCLRAWQAEAARDVARHDSVFLTQFKLLHTLDHGGVLGRRVLGGFCRRGGRSLLALHLVDFLAQAQHFVAQLFKVLGRLGHGRQGDHGRGQQGQAQGASLHDGSFVGWGCVGR